MRLTALIVRTRLGPEQLFSFSPDLCFFPPRQKNKSALPCTFALTHNLLGLPPPRQCPVSSILACIFPKFVPRYFLSGA